MDYLKNIPHCIEVLQEQIDVRLIHYSHIPTAILVLLVGTFVFVKSKKMPASKALFGFSISFALWSISDLVTWVLLDNSQITLFAWTFIDIFAVIQYMFILGFIYCILNKRSLPLWMHSVFGVLLVPLILFTLLPSHLNTYDLVACEAVENSVYLAYVYGVQLLLTVWMVFLLIQGFWSSAKDRRLLTTVLGVGSLFFALVFLSSGFLASYFENFNLSIYGLFGIPVFVVAVGYIIIRFQILNIRLLTAQALIMAMIFSVGSQFFYTRGLVGQLLNAFTLILVGVSGFYLNKSVVQINRQAADLQQINNQQTNLIQFITHQVKGFFTKTRNIFSSGLEGDFGPMSDIIKRAFQEGKESDDRAVAMVQELLNATNIRRGTVQYEMKKIELSKIVRDICNNLTKSAKAKLLNFEIQIEEGEFFVMADELHIRQAIKNLIDNAIRYTNDGFIKVELKRRKNSVAVLVKDSGVGLSPDDLPRLFTEGGRGKDSRKVNTESTGYGLYIVKNVIEQHKGHVTAYSEGVGKGSEFSVDLPLVA